MGTTGIESVEALAARLAIADLLYGYARAVRNGDPAACTALFTDDAVFEIREASIDEPSGYRVRQILNGRTEIQTYLQHGSVASVRVWPLIHNPIIRVNGAEAASNSMMTAWVLPAGRQIIGEYQDRYRCDHGWRFAARVYTILGQAGPG